MTEVAGRRRGFGGRVATIARLYVAGLRTAWRLRRQTVTDILSRERVSPALAATTRQLEEPESLVRLGDQIFRLRFFPFPNRCLVKSIVLYSVLRPAWPDLRLVLGLRRVPGRASNAMQGHAWLTLHGRPLSGLDRHAPEAFGATVELGGDQP